MNFESNLEVMNEPLRALAASLKRSRFGLMKRKIDTYKRKKENQKKGAERQRD